MHGSAHILPEFVGSAVLDFLDWWFRDLTESLAPQENMHGDGCDGWWGGSQGLTDQEGCRPGAGRQGQVPGGRQRGKEPHGRRHGRLVSAPGHSLSSWKYCN